MSYLADLYKKQPSTLGRDVAAFVENPQNIPDELESLRAVLSSPSYEKIEALFVIDILSQTLKKQQDFTSFVTIVLEHIETILAYKNSVFILRILRSLINTRFFLPTAYYLTQLLSSAITAPKLTSTGKRFDYDSVRLSSDDLRTEELQIFVTGECLGLIRQQALSFGNSIGFPEYAFVLCNELRTKCKVGAFKEVVGDLLKSITDRKAYIEAERAKEKTDVLNGKIVANFEQKLAKWEI